MADLVERTWNGPFIGELPYGGVVHPGDKLQVTKEQSESAHFLTPSQRAKAESSSEKSDS